MKPRLISHLLRILCFLIVTTIFVPPFAESYASWAHLLKEWSIRLAVAIGFLLITTPIRNLETVNNYRITLPPPEPRSAAEPISFEIQNAALGSVPLLKLPLRQRIIFALCACIFLVSFASDLNKSIVPLSSPRGAVNLVYSLCGSFCLALIIGWEMSQGLLIWERAGESAAARIWALLRRWAAPLMLIFLVAAFPVISKGAPPGLKIWADRVAESSIGWVIGLVCLGFFYLFWLPKPSEMSADQPELLHVVPSSSSTMPNR